MTEVIVTIKTHEYIGGKWDYDYYGNRSISPDWGKLFRHKHAKFRLLPNKNHPKGKPKVERFSADVDDAEIILSLNRKYNQYIFKTGHN